MQSPHAESEENENKRACRERGEMRSRPSALLSRLRVLVSSVLAKLHAHIFRARAERGKKRGTERSGRERERKGDGNTRVIPGNFREIALTSFSRGHTAIATLQPRVHFTADSATNFTDAATNIAIGNSF